MPQHSLFPDDPIDISLRLTVFDHTAVLEDAITVTVEVAGLDLPWQTLIRIPLHGAGRDYLVSMCEDLVHAWLYESRRAIVREAQRNERHARQHARKQDRLGG